MNARLLWMSALVSLGIFGVMEGCSSSSNDTGSEADATDQDRTTGSDASFDTSAQSDTSTGLDSSTQDSGSGFDADFGDVILIDAPYEGGLPCVVGGTVEQEPNDNGPFVDGGDAGGPNVVPEGVICGAISPNTDVDWFVHHLRADAGPVSIIFNGDVKIVLSVDELDGGTQDLATFQPNGQSQTYTVIPGRDHFLKVTSNDGTAQTYLIRIAVQ